MKKSHSAMVKFKVALAAITGQPMTDICRAYEVAESSIHKWKKQLKENGVAAFSQKEKNQKLEHEQEMAKLYQRIGQLTTEIEFLKKVVEA